MIELAGVEGKFIKHNKIADGKLGKINLSRTTLFSCGGNSLRPSSFLGCSPRLLVRLFLRVKVKSSFLLGILASRTVRNIP